MNNFTYNVYSRKEQSVNDNLKLVNIIFSVNLEGKEMRVKDHPIFFQITYYVDKKTNLIKSVGYVGECSGEWEIYIDQVDTTEKQFIEQFMYNYCYGRSKEEIAEAVHY